MTDLPLPPLPQSLLRGLYGPKDLQAYAREYGRMVQERCAALCEAVAYKDCHEWRRNAVEQCAAAIRANKEAT